MTPVIAAALRKALSWLAKRGKTASKHVGHHTRPAVNVAKRNKRYLSRALGQSPHSIFRDPKSPKKLIEKALREPTETAVQAGGKRDAYVIVEKEFGRAIGKGGETRLKVVINERTGRIVTAYPVRSAAVAGALAAGAPEQVIGAEFDHRVEETSRVIDKMITEYEGSRRGKEPGLIEQVLDFLIGATPAGEPAEGLYQHIDSLVAFQTEELIKEVERAVGQKLTAGQRERVAAQFRAALAGGEPLTLDDEE